jgi:hypothetical protein
MKGILRQRVGLGRRSHQNMQVLGATELGAECLETWPEPRAKAPVLTTLVPVLEFFCDGIANKRGPGSFPVLNS